MGSSYPEKGKGIVGKEEYVIVVDGVYMSLIITICLQKGSYWVRSRVCWGCLRETFGPEPGQRRTWQKPGVQQAAAGHRVRDDARPWQWHAKRLPRYPDHLHAVVCTPASCWAPHQEQALRKGIHPPGTQWEPLSYPHSPKWCKKKSC